MDVEAVVGGDPLDLGPRPISDAVTLLRAEHDVLEDRQVVGKHEVLEDHADACIDRIRWAVQGERLAVDLDRALIGSEYAVQDLHQGGLARAILADDGMNGAPLYREGHVPVGHNPGETFGDALQLDGRRHHRSRVRDTVGRVGDGAHSSYGARNVAGDDR